MVRVAIYVRVSSDQQVKEGDSIPAQLDALRKYVNSRPDAVIAGEYIDDGVSGQKFTRDALQALLDAVKAGDVDLIAFTKLDRWFRSVRHYTATQETLDKHGVAWLAIWEPIYDTSSKRKTPGNASAPFSPTRYKRARQSAVMSHSAMPSRISGSFLRTTPQPCGKCSACIPGTVLSPIASASLMRTVTDALNIASRQCSETRSISVSSGATRHTVRQ